MRSYAHVRRSFGGALLILIIFPVLVFGQSRDSRGQRLVLDDDAADGGWNTMTIRPPGPMSINTVLTIPDPGVGSANFLLSESSTPQAINGDFTFNGNINFTGATVVGLSGGGSVGTNASLLGDGIGGDPLRLNLANGNIWTTTQTFAGISMPTGNLNITTGNIAVTTGNISTTTGGISTSVGDLSTASGDVRTSSGNLSAGNGGELRLLEPSGGGTDYTALKSGAQAGNITYTLPAANGSAGQFLRIAASPTPTASTAALEWATPSGSGGLASVGGIVFARKTADEGVTSSTTLQNDDHLVVALNANQGYEIEGVLYAATDNNAHDLSLAFTVPAGATMKIGYHSVQENGTTVREADVLTSSGTIGTVVDLSSANNNIMFIRGLVRTGGTAGDVQLQWSDDSSSGTQTVTLQADSYIKVQRVE